MLFYKKGNQTVISRIKSWTLYLTLLLLALGVAGPRAAAQDLVYRWPFSHGPGYNHSAWASLSPDGKLLAAAVSDTTGQARDAMVWDTATRKIVATLHGQYGPATFSPDGKLLVTAAQDNTITIWDLPTLKVVNNLKGHFRPIVASGAIDAVTFSPDGRTLASTGAVGLDTAIKLWDVASAKTPPP